MSPKANNIYQSTIQTYYHNTSLMQMFSGLQS